MRLDESWWPAGAAGPQSLAFSVLAAWLYETGAARGRPSVADGETLRASQQARSPDWAGVLKVLPGVPLLVVCDADKAIHGALRRAWPAPPTPRPQFHGRTGRPCLPRRS